MFYTFTLTNIGEKTDERAIDRQVERTAHVMEEGTIIKKTDMNDRKASPKMALNRLIS